MGRIQTFSSAMKTATADCLVGTEFCAGPGPGKSTPPALRRWRPGLKTTQLPESLPLPTGPVPVVARFEHYPPASRVSRLGSWQSDSPPAQGRWAPDFVSSLAVVVKPVHHRRGAGGVRKSSVAQRSGWRNFWKRSTLRTDENNILEQTRKQRRPVQDERWAGR